MTVYTIISPAEGPLGATFDEARWTPIVASVTPTAGELPMVIATLDEFDILTAYDGSAFAPLFADHSTVSEAGGVYTLSLLPSGGWLRDVTILFGSVEDSETVLEFEIPEEDDEGADAPILTKNESLLGRDILFESGNTIVGPSGDYRTVEDEYNLKLALIRMFVTAQREYAMNPNYGIGANATVKEPASESEIDALRARAFEKIAQDRRVARVNDVMVLPKGSNPSLLRVILDVTPIAGKDLLVDFDTATLRLG